jgi:hypothetical protein
MASPLLEQAKIQAQVLIPVLRAFRDELGTERANRIAWRALAGWRRQVAREQHAAFSGSGRERWAAGVAAALPMIGDAVDAELLAQSDEAFDFDVTGCRFAEFFRQLGEPELGFALLCSFDDTTAEEIGAGEVQLTRTGTIMQGAARCDFRYALKKAGL